LTIRSHVSSSPTLCRTRLFRINICSFYTLAFT
jgi:hypothetical protein